jgi:serine/threonine-protein kinase HipA
VSRLNVTIEIRGEQVFVGTIFKKGADAPQFQYAPEYLDLECARPISIHLPLQADPFSPKATRQYFEGLLPEGFTRRSVAAWIHADADDYFTLLKMLGRECLGAVAILDPDEPPVSAAYEPLSIEQVRNLANEGVSVSTELVTKSHLSLTGASGKVGLYLNPETGRWFLPKGSAPSTHIVKQSHVRLDNIVANEQLALTTASRLGIGVPFSFIINVGEGRDQDVLLATKRYDRSFSRSRRTAKGTLMPQRLHQEDFTQALGISAANKYEGEKDSYLPRMFALLRHYSANPIVDQMHLWDLVIFNYLIGNTDAHLKNFSLLYDENLTAVRLAPAYDLISTSIYPSSTRNMAFKIGDHLSLDEITPEDFKRSAKACGIGLKIAEKHFTKMRRAFKPALERAAASLIEQGFVNARYLTDRILKTGGCRQVI